MGLKHLTVDKWEVSERNGTRREPPTGCGGLRATRSYPTPRNTLSFPRGATRGCSRSHLGRAQELHQGLPGWLPAAGRRAEDWKEMGSCTTTTQHPQQPSNHNPTTKQHPLAPAPYSQFGTTSRRGVPIALPSSGCHLCPQKDSRSSPPAPFISSASPCSQPHRTQLHHITSLALY